MPPHWRKKESDAGRIARELDEKFGQPEYAPPQIDSSPELRELTLEQILEKLKEADGKLKVIKKEKDQYSNLRQKVYPGTNKVENSVDYDEDQ